MGTFNGNTRDARFAAAGKHGAKRSAGAGLQILFSLLLLLDLFLLYTIIMQMTHQQKAFQLSLEPKTNNLIDLGLLVVLALGAAALLYAVIRTRAWKRTICLLLIFAVLYLVAVFSEIPLVKKYRDIWLSTALSTMKHQGLATYYFPASVVDERLEIEKNAREAQIGENSEDTFTDDADEHVWLDPEKAEGLAIQDEEFVELPADQQAFYGLFYELDRNSAEAYFEAHPEALENGYEHILINETAIGGDGTSIRTKLGEKVLAIDTENQILIVEVDCDGSRGVLAVAKLPSRLHLFPAKSLPYYGEITGSIAKRNGGVLAMTGSSFDDPDGVGNGGKIAGWAMTDGKEHGEHFGWGYKRLELHDNGWFYITDAPSAIGQGTTNAMEFQPALVINGKKMDVGIWTSQNPRACIGQSSRGEILMLCVEGRRVGSPGCSVAICADVLLTHDCLTALNCDGGTTAMLWYRGEPIIRCSNSATPQGRYLPNAWVYLGE
jgi:exopolysaccharide biosynthesis protein